MAWLTLVGVGLGSLSLEVPMSYETDILDWSGNQAALLRRLAAGERVNDRIDWENVIEEIESVGRSELRAVESHIIQALLHDLKTRAWPLSAAVPHWRAEARGHRKDARRHFTPSMRSQIDMEELYRDALGRLPETIDGQLPMAVPEVCPVSLDEMVAGDP